LDLNTQEKIENLFDNFKEFLKEKNKRYGDSALDPCDIFKNVIDGEKDFAVKSILIRLSDKLKRISNSTELRKNDVSDLFGYLALLMIKKGWLDFNEMLD
jgi:hypothetical protein